MRNKKLVFIGTGGLNSFPSQQITGLSIVLTSPELAVSLEEMAGKNDVSDLSVEEMIVAIPEDQQSAGIPENPSRFMTFDPSQDFAIRLQEKLAEHLSGCSLANPYVIKAAPQEKDIPREKILPMDFDRFLDFSEDHTKTNSSNRDRQIPRNFSRRQFQKCRR